ncbi:MAG: DUF2124 domain-containing protein [Methanosarcinaceae archaeon]|nr:DUF2124 domain-containing protein [Methanosarcinaceae archaeon]MDD4332432.1 DUF2124 domain-containing protein [Methanosarcinaceae archaeon]MDD4749984.1 DUF2124 domain-containing protein [Methanosarcinaceae archaeon]
MQIIKNSQGVGGLLNSFKSLVEDSEKLTFVGTPGFCTPFAELLGFVVRKKQLAFLPNLNFEAAKSISMTTEGMQLGGSVDPQADTVVFLGGLAMPKIGVEAKAAQELADKILKSEKKGKIIGVCFQSMFIQQKWDEIIDFDYILNADLGIEVMKA